MHQNNNDYQHVNAHRDPEARSVTGTSMYLTYDNGKAGRPGIAAYNIKELRRSFEEVQHMFGKVDVLILGETWMRGCVVDLQEMVDEYALALSQESMKKGFGGVAILIKQMLQYELVNKLE